MNYYVDTNAMRRRFATGDLRYLLVKATLDRIIRRGDTVPISAQNLVEFQAVATRPLDANGPGLTTTEASAKAREIEALFSFLPDNADIYPHWRRLIERHDVKGKQVHDARIVAVMLAHNINRHITFNASHFIRFSEITVFDPQDMR